jgi:putative transposase
MTNLDYRFFYRRHLPHFQPPDATLFLTFRLAGSLTSRILDELARETQRVDNFLNSIDDLTRRQLEADIARRRLFAKWDTALAMDVSGPRWLEDDQVRSIAQTSLHFLDGKMYDLDAYCIMPNVGKSSALRVE